MLRASLGKIVHTVKRAGTYAAKVPPQELHKIAVNVRAVGTLHQSIFTPADNFPFVNGPDLDGPVEGVEGELCEAGDLAGEVPAVLQAEHDAAALQVYQVGDGARQLHHALQQRQPLAPLHQLQEGLLLCIVPLHAK
jgi:hypothetical protein